MGQAKIRFSSKDIIRNFGSLSDAAVREPVIITKSGRDRLVLMSVEVFEKLERATQIPVRAEDEVNS